jgi:hypothetical protein
LITLSVTSDFPVHFQNNFSSELMTAKILWHFTENANCETSPTETLRRFGEIRWTAPQTLQLRNK